MWFCPCFSPLAKRDNSSLFVAGAETVLQSTVPPLPPTMTGPRAAPGDGARRSLQMEGGLNPHGTCGCFSSGHALDRGDSRAQPAMIPTGEPPIACGVSCLPGCTAAGSSARTPSPLAALPHPYNGDVVISKKPIPGPPFWARSCCLCSHSILPSPPSHMGPTRLWQPHHVSPGPVQYLVRGPVW